MASLCGAVQLRESHTKHLIVSFMGLCKEKKNLFVRVFAGPELASGSLWQVAGQSCGLFSQCFCVCPAKAWKGGQPCNPMRAPTPRTNEGIVCTSRKH